MALATTAAGALAGVTFAAGSASGAGITNLGDESGSAFTLRGNLVAFANPLSADSGNDWIRARDRARHLIRCGRRRDLPSPARGPRSPDRC